MSWNTKKLGMSGFLCLLGSCLLVGCLVINLPENGSYHKETPIPAEISLRSDLCGTPLAVFLNGLDVTRKFSSNHPGVKSPLSGNFYELPPGPYRLEASADMLSGFPFQSCKPEISAVNFTVGEQHDTPYMQECRVKGVPIPPDWPGTAWASHGDLTEKLIEQQYLASVWSYADPRIRGACIALGRGDGSFGVICQSATTGYACFWQNGGRESEVGQIDWKPDKKMQIQALRDPYIGFKEPCVLCHRGSNAYIFSPDDDTWAKVLRPPLDHSHPGAGTPYRPTFTTRLESSSQHWTVTLPNGEMKTYPRFTPIGPLGWNNPLPQPDIQCGACHERHIMISAAGIPVPKPAMPPACAKGSQPDDPAYNCYRME